MSAQVKLSSKMPGDFETNGIDTQAGQLVNEPETIRCAVIWYDTSQVTIDTDSDSHVPTVRVRRIEPIGDAGDVTTAVRDIVDKAHEQRTGRKPLPFDVVEVIDGDTLDGDES